MAQAILFEHPLNEQTRTLLRIAHLFEQYEYHLPGDAHWQSRAALVALLDVAAILARPDIKGDLLKLLDAQAKTLAQMAHNPKVNQPRLQQVLTDIKRIARQLQSIGGQLGNSLRKSEYLNSILQRECIPGGSFEFDLPQFHFWLNLPHAERVQQLRTWQQDIQVVQEAAELILGILRNSAIFTDKTCELGIYQQSLDSKRPVQLIQVSVAQELDVYAAISGSKHRFCIRFMDVSDWDRPEQSRQNLSFRLKTCAI